MKNESQKSTDFGQELLKKREASGYSYLELASLLNEIVSGVGEFSPAELQKWEQVEPDLKNPRIFATAQFFGIDIHSFLKSIQVKETKSKK